MEELQLALVRMRKEKDAWKNKCQTLEISYRAYLEEKDDLIETLESRAVETMERQGEFSPKPHSDSSCSLPDSGDWKEVSTRYAE